MDYEPSSPVLHLMAGIAMAVVTVYSVRIRKAPDYKPEGAASESLASFAIWATGLISLFLIVYFIIKITAVRLLVE